MAPNFDALHHDPLQQLHLREVMHGGMDVYENINARAKKSGPFYKVLCCCCWTAKGLRDLLTTDASREFALAFIIGEAFGAWIESLANNFVGPLIQTIPGLTLCCWNLVATSSYILLAGGANFDAQNPYPSAELALQDGARAISWVALLNDSLQFLITMLATYWLFSILERLAQQKKAERRKTLAAYAQQAHENQQAAQAASAAASGAEAGALGGAQAERASSLERVPASQAASTPLRPPPVGAQEGLKAFGQAQRSYCFPTGRTSVNPTSSCPSGPREADLSASLGSTSKPVPVAAPSRCVILVLVKARDPLRLHGISCSLPLSAVSDTFATRCVESGIEIDEPAEARPPSPPRVRPSGCAASTPPPSPPMPNAPQPFKAAVANLADGDFGPSEASSRRVRTTVSYPTNGRRHHRGTHHGTEPGDESSGGGGHADLGTETTSRRHRQHHHSHHQGHSASPPASSLRLTEVLAALTSAGFEIASTAPMHDVCTYTLVGQVPIVGQGGAARHREAERGLLW